MIRSDFIEKFESAANINFDGLKNKPGLVQEINAQQLQEILSLCEAELGFSLSILKASAWEMVGEKRVLNMIFKFPEMHSELILSTVFSKSDEPPKLEKIWPYAKVWGGEYPFENTEAVQWHQC